MLTEDQQILEQIEKAANILITFPKNYGGDALGSALALYLFLKKSDKKLTVAADGFQSSGVYSFLPKINEISSSITDNKKFIIRLDTTKTQAKEISYQIKDGYLEFVVIPKEGRFFPEQVSAHPVRADYDLIITVSSPDLESLGDIYRQNMEFFFNCPIINIDHSPRNEKFGQINRIRITAISTTEIIFKLLNDYASNAITKEIATCLLTGIFSESKGFKVGSITPNSLLTASQLIALEADREAIVKNLYQSRNLSTLKLWGRVLAKIKSEHNGKLIWSCLNKIDFEKTGGAVQNIEDVIEELIINVPEAEVIAIFTEDESFTGESDGGGHQTYVNIYSTKNINVLSLLKEFGAIGSKNQISFVLDKSITESETAIINFLKEKLSKLPL